MWLFRETFHFTFHGSFFFFAQRWVKIKRNNAHRINLMSMYLSLVVIAQKTLVLQRRKKIFFVAFLLSVFPLFVLYVQVIKFCTHTSWFRFSLVAWELAFLFALVRESKEHVCVRLSVCTCPWIFICMWVICLFSCFWVSVTAFVWLVRMCFFVHCV